MVWISTLPHITRNNHLEQSTPKRFMKVSRLRFLGARGKERGERERWKEKGEGRERHRERMCVCVCVCEREREREREKCQYCEFLIKPRQNTEAIVSPEKMWLVCSLLLGTRQEVKVCPVGRIGEVKLS